MTIQAVPTFLVPHNLGQDAASATGLGVSGVAVATLDAANEALAIVFCCPKGTSLTDIGYRTQTVAVTSGPLNFDVRLETLTDGRPSGTLWGTNTNAASSVANTDDNVWKSVTLTAAATVAQGDHMALVIKAPSSGTFSFTLGGFSGLGANNGMFPIVVQDITGTPDGTYETLATGGGASVAVKISGAWYRIEPFSPILTLSTITAASGAENAMRFTTPVGLRVRGASLFLQNIAAAGTFTVSIWPDSAGTQTDANALTQVTLDSDLVGGATVDSPFTTVFPSSIDLAANTVYWLGVRADTATNTSTLSATCTSTDVMAAMPGGANCYLGQRTWSGGSVAAFTPTTTQVPYYAFIVEGIDAGSGGGLSAIGHAG